MSIGARTYAKAPVWLQDLLVSAYGVYLHHLRYGRIHRRELVALLASQWYPKEELDNLQRRRLAEVLAWAKREVPHYANLPAARARDPLSSLNDVPLLTKDTVRNAGERLLALSHRHRRLVQIHTGGTTGTPLTIHTNRATLQRNYAFFARLRTWAGAPTGARTATFAGRLVVPTARGYPFWRHNLSINTLICSSYHLSADTVHQYAEALARFAPALIDTYPSSIEPIARHLLHDDKTVVRPRAVVTSSETLSHPTRAHIEQAFRCPVFDYYGAAEMAAFISQCEAGTYHVNPEFGIVEVLKDGEPVSPGGEGEIVATGFINPIMPFIRYATGDLAIQGDDAPCRCGRAFPTLGAVIGRLDDVIVTPEGRRVGRLDPVFKVLETVRETRIVQDAPDHVRVEIVPEARTASAELTQLKSELRARLGPNMRIDIIKVSAIERAASGKLRTVVNLVAQSTEEQQAGATSKAADM